MKLVALPEVATIIMGQSPPSSSYNARGEGLPFFQGKVDFGDVYPTMRMFCTEPSKVAEAGDILISVRAPVGPTNISPAKCCIGRGLAAIRCSQVIELKYLLYFLRFYEPELVQASTGSTFDAISRDDLENIQVPLLTLPEQQRIAAILAKADRLRRLRRAARELGDTYLQSVFLEMFYTNASPDWPHVRITSLARKGKNTIRTGPFGSQLLHSEFVDKGILVLGIDNAVQNRFAWGKPRFITEEKYRQLKRYTVYPGDVIITIMGTNGRCAVIPDDIPLAINTKHLCCITLDQSICLPTYLQSCFLIHPSVLQQLGGSERGAIMPGLNMGIIADLIVPLPPLPLQQQFAAIVRQFERLRAQQREAERQAEHLFQTLLHRAFRGEI
jgi:type I restriction enzyme S subunit